MKKIRLSRAVLDQKEVAAFKKVVADGYLAMGAEVKLFEDELKRFFGGKRSVIAVNTGTSALHLAVAAVTSPGDEVLVQSLTFVASFQAISGAGAVPVACEIDPKTLTIDLKDAERKLTKRTKAIMPVHYASDPGNLNAIYAFAKKHKLRVIEDAAHAFGTLYQGKRIGSFGDIVCFSFDPIKNITCGDGGAVVTGDAKVAQYVQDARLLGVHKDSERRYQGGRTWAPEVMHQGYRFHMSNIAATIGRAQLAKFSKFKAARQRLAQRYQAMLSGIPGITIFKKDYRKIVPHIFSVRVLGGRRDALKEFLGGNSVETGVHYFPNHRLQYFAKKGATLPMTDLIYGQLLTLPLHAALTIQEQDKVLSLIRKFMKAN